MKSASPTWSTLSRQIWAQRDWPYDGENLWKIFMETFFSPLTFFVESFGALAGFLDGLLAIGVPPKKILESKTADELTGHPKPQPKKIAADTSTGDR